MLSALFAVLLGAGPGPTTVAVRLSEWKVELAQTTVPAGSVTFTVTNAGSIPHAIEVEGRGVEKEIPVIQPGATGSLTLMLAPGNYEVYCPVGEDSHKKLGMMAHLRVVPAGQAAPAVTRTAESAPPPTVRAISVTGGGPVIQIL